MGGNPVIKGRNLLRRQSQSKFGSPPHDVFGGASPFLRYQVPDFGLRQARTEGLAEIVNGAVTLMVCETGVAGR